MSRIVDPETALADVAWLHRLARQLVRDPHLADDLAQDTWLAALRHGLGGVANVRAWLATTLRNAARLGSRQRRREQVRQAISARPEAVDPSCEMAARLQEQRMLLAAVEQLGEPSRTAIMLRYLEGLPPRRIAAQLGVPVATVQTRLKRGLERLRTLLDERHGSRHGWMAVLLPWARRGPSLMTAPWLLGGWLLMHTQWKTGLAAALLLSAVGVFAWTQSEAPQAVPAQAADNGQQLAAASADVAVQTADAAPSREVVPTPAGPPAAASATDAAATQRVVRGRAIRLDGAPLAQIAIACRQGSARTTTLADGSFALLASAALSEIEVADPAWTTLFFGDASHGEAAERIVVAAPRVRLHGRVVDESQQPIAGVAARIWLPPALRARLPLVLDYSSPRHWTTLTDAAGRFDLPDCAQLPDVDVAFTHDGYRRALHALTDGMDDVVVVLRRQVAGDGTLSGCVLDPAGQLLTGAHVAAGGAATITDERGEFALAKDEIGDDAQLTAVARGFVPARMPVAKQAGYVTLQLSQAALELAGVVVDAEGRPMPHCKVWVADPTYFGQVDQLMVTAEGMSGNATDRAELETAWKELGSLSEEERAARLPPDRLWNFARTDATGRFRLGGLAPRTYRVSALDERTLLQAEFGPFAAGATDLRLPLPTGRVFPTLSGRIVDSAGEPVPGTRVQVRVDVLRVGSSGSFVRRSQTRNPVAAGDDGAFTLRDVPEQAGLWITGDAIETLEFAADRRGGLRDAVADPSRLEIVVQRRCHFRVELRDPTMADSIQVLDAAGQALQVHRLEGTSTYSSAQTELHDGRTPVLNVLASARTLVLCKGGREVKRLELALVPGGDNLITP